MHNHQPLFARHVNREGRTTTRAQCRMTTRNSRLDVLWVKVAATNDEKILESSGNIQLSFAQESEVTRTQKRAIASISQVGCKRLRGLFGTIPVAGGDAPTR